MVGKHIALQEVVDKEITYGNAIGRCIEKLPERTCLKTSFLAQLV